MDLLNPPATGRWAYQMPFCLQNDYKIAPESQQQIQTMAAKLASTRANTCPYGWTHDNYGEDSYNEVLSLKRANVVADAWAMVDKFRAISPLRV